MDGRDPHAVLSAREGSILGYAAAPIGPRGEQGRRGVVQNAGGIKTSAFIALDSAEVFLHDLPDPMLAGLPVNVDRVAVDRIEDMASLRLVLDGGGRFPDFTDAPPAFSDIGSPSDGP